MEIIKDLIFLKYVPDLTNNVTYGILFVFGFLTSFHCIVMCGGLALSQSIKNKGTKINIIPSLLYNVSRVISYTLIGGIVGGLGHIVRFSTKLNSLVPIIGGVFLIIMAINLMDIFPFLRKFSPRLPTFIAKKIYKNNNYSPIVLGLLSGLMPCGPLQIAQLYALGTGSILVGSASMFVFSLGTVPLLLGFGIINSMLSKKFSKIFVKVSAVLVLVLGISMIGRGLALNGMSVEVNNKTAEDSIVKSTVKGDFQEVSIKIEADSYKAISVTKGIPVRWHINVYEEDLNDCNNAINIPKFKIEKKLEVGDNVVEFLPEESGEYVYTCWMGMIKSKIVVVE